MATITPTREDLDPYFTVTWAGINPADTCTPFDGLHATLLSVQSVVSGFSGGPLDLFGSNEDTFSPIPSSSQILSSFPLPGIVAAQAQPIPKVRWFAPFVPSGSTAPATTVILLFRDDH